MDIIKAILDIEDKAQRIVGTLDEMCSENEKEIEAEIESMTAEMKSHAEFEIEKYKNETEEKKNQETEEIERSMQQKKAALEKTFADNRESWLRDITEAIIKDERL